MAEVINNLIDGLLALIIFGAFILLVWARVQKKKVSELLNDLFADKPIKPISKTKWQQPKTI